MLAGPETATPEGVPFAEARMAAHLGTETVLIDVTGGATGAAAGIASAAEELDCDLLVGVDVGGDVLARGDEPGLASPLCDAVMVAAALRIAGRVKPLLAVIGPGCDGELTVAEVLERVAELARAGAWLGAWGVTPRIADELDAATAAGAHRGQPAGRPLRSRRGGRRVHPPRPAPRRAGARGGAGLRLRPRRRALPRRFPWPTRWPMPTASRRAAPPWPPCGIHTELDYERGRAGEPGEPAHGVANLPHPPRGRGAPEDRRPSPG